MRRAPPTITPATSGTLADFFTEKGVKLEPQASRDFKALNIVLPMPQGWAQVPDPNVPDAFAVIADRVGGNGLYSSNAQVVVYKLVGGSSTRRRPSATASSTASSCPRGGPPTRRFADFGGMPSSVIEGTYRENSMTLNTSRAPRHRHRRAPTSTWSSLSVTTSVDQVVAAADATDAIIKGFRVSVAGARRLPPPSPPAPGPAQACRRRRNFWDCRDRGQSSSPGRSLAPGGRPIRHACGRASYCVAHADRRGALSVRRRRDRRRSACGC